MPATLKERIEILEQQVRELTAAQGTSSVKEKDWQRTFGMSANDEGFDEMVELGKKARAEANRLKPRRKNAGA